MADLSVNFAGIKSPNPFWLASAPPTNCGYQIMRAFDAGWGGAVWKTLAVPVINVSSRYGSVNYRDTRMAGFNNIELVSDRPVKDNLKEIEEVKRYFPDNAIIASMMFGPREEWHQVVEDVQNAGADGIELNFGCPHGMNERGMGSAVGQNPQALETITGWVMEKANIPVIVKLTPNITDITEPALAAQRGGADAISLINTIQSLIGIDLDTFAPYPVVDGMGTNGGYCGPAVKPIALNMVKNCAKHPDFSLPISGIGGVENWRDAVEFILVGAGSVQVCTAAMHYGFGIIREIVSGLEQYMNGKGFATIEEMRGKALPNITTWEHLNLKYKITAEIDRETCIGCQLCYIACEDGAHQAIDLSSDPEDRIPSVNDENCVGCNLCSLVCPVENCISMVRRDDGNVTQSWKDKVLAVEIPTDLNDEKAGGLSHKVPPPSDALKGRSSQ